MMDKAYYLFYFILYLSWSAVFSLHTIYMNEVIGLDLKTIGLLLSSIPLIHLAFQPIWGAVADATQKPKHVLSVLVLFTAASAFAITLTSGQGIFVLLFILYSAFLCGQGPLSDAMAVDFVKKSSKRSFGGIRVWGSAGYAVGAYIASALALKYGLAWIFYIAIAGFLLSSGVVFLLDKTPVRTDKGNYKEAIKVLIKDGRYVFVLCYGFLLVGSFFGVDQYLSLYTRSRGLDVGVIGMITFIAVCVEMPLIFSSRRMVKRFGAMPLLVLVNLMSIVRLLYLSTSTHITGFIIGGVLRGLIVGIFIPLFIELISEISPSSVLNSAVALYTAISTGIAVFVFAYIGSLIADHFGYATLFAAYGIFQLVPLAIISAMSYKKRQVH